MKKALNKYKNFNLLMGRVQVNQFQLCRKLEFYVN